MKKSAKWVVFISILSLVAGFLMAGSMLVAAEETATEGAESAVVPEEGASAIDTTGMAKLGKVEAVVWDDFIIEEVSDPTLEGINDITVELYLQDSKSKEWKLWGSKKTANGGYSKPVPYGWVGWSELPVVNDFSTFTYYKMKLVPPEGVEPLNGVERIVPLRISNAWYCMYFEVSDAKNRPAFEVDGVSLLTEDCGFIEAVVWDDEMLPDYTDSCSEGINGLTVELYRKNRDGGWDFYDRKKTGPGGFSKIVPYGWVGWSNLPVVKDLRATTQYKLVLVDDGTFRPLNECERIVRLNSSNNYFRYFFEVSDTSSLRAFEIRCISCLPVENIGRIEAIVWDDAVLPDVTDSRKEGVQDIVVNLYKKDENGEWQLYDSKSTASGGFIWPCEHGWVGWSELPVVMDPRVRTWYKLSIVTDGTFNPVGSTERVFSLNSSNLWFREFFEVEEDATLAAFKIKSTTVLISGIVWHDMNANMTRDWFEPICSGWTIMLTDRWGRKIATTTTNNNGYYQFRGLKPGTYIVWEKSLRGWNQVKPMYKLCTWPPYGYEKGHYVVRGEAGKYYINKNFGNMKMSELLAPLLYSLWWAGLLAYQLVP